MLMVYSMGLNHPRNIKSGFKTEHLTMLYPEPVIC